MSPRRLILAVLATTLGALALTATPALAAAPTVVSESVPSVTPFEARLEAVVNAGEEAAGKTTECNFEYGVGSISEHKVPCEQGTPPGTLEGGEQGVSLNVSGLTPKTPYLYRVVVKNATGKAEGIEEGFTTATPVKPEVESESASVNATEATLNAQVNPDYQKTTFTFEYATNKALTGAKTLTGTVEGPPGQTASVSTGATLQPGEIYYYRVVAENETSEEEGKSVDGAVQSFTTVPTPFTDTATPTSGIGARFEGHFTLISVDTKWSFDYKLGSECTGENSTPTVDGGTGTGTATEAWEVPSAEEPTLGWPSAPPLHPNTAYTVCFVTSNAYGSQVGSPEHFTTPTAPPSIDSESASGQGPAGMTLEAKIDPNLQETTYSFEYATAEALIGTPGATRVAGENPLAAELAELPVSVKIAVVPQPGTTYYYRVVAENESTTIEHNKPATGEIKSFALPLVTTGEAQGITRTTATLSGEVNPAGVETTYYFAYISEAGYQTALTKGAGGAGGDPYSEGETTAPLSSSSDEAVAVAPTLASGLLPGETYHYALVAKNAVGSTIGPDRTLTTLSGTPPIVSTGGVSAVSQNSATLSGTVSTNSLQTEYGFEIGTEPGNYGPATGLGSLGGAATEAVSLTLSKLQPGRTYYYRVTASNADGTEKGQPASFTTPGFPTLLTPQTSPPLIATPNIAFPKEEKASGTTTTTKTLTNKEKLKKALKACHAKKGKKRSGCEAAAKKKYGGAKKKK